MRISDWSSDVCSSDLLAATGTQVSGRKWVRSRWILPIMSSSQMTIPVPKTPLKSAGPSWRRPPALSKSAVVGRRLRRRLLRRVLTRSEEHTSELQSLMRISYAVFCLKTKQQDNKYKQTIHQKIQN